MHYIEPPDVFDVLYSVKAIVMVLLGGAGTLFGPLIGAALFLSLEELVWRPPPGAHWHADRLASRKGALAFRPRRA